jgi:transcriptional regulator with XRE-family HTH domain
MENDQMIDSDIVRTLRKKAGWSQEQLAIASGISLRTIQRVEAEGKSSRETKVCLAATFNVQIDDLELKAQVNEIAPKRNKNLFTFILFFCH